MKDHRTPPAACLDCGYAVDAAAGMTTDNRPDPGDISICLMCGHIMAFADDLTFRPLTDAEMIDIAGDPKIVAMQRARARTIG